MTQCSINAYKLVLNIPDGDLVKHFQWHGCFGMGVELDQSGDINECRELGSRGAYGLGNGEELIHVAYKHLGESAQVEDDCKLAVVLVHLQFGMSVHEEGDMLQTGGRMALQF